MYKLVQIITINQYTMKFCMYNGALHLVEDQGDGELILVAHGDENETKIFKQAGEVEVVELDFPYPEGVEKIKEWFAVNTGKILKKYCESTEKVLEKDAKSTEKIRLGSGKTTKARRFLPDRPSLKVRLEDAADIVELLKDVEVLRMSPRLKKYQDLMLIAKEGGNVPRPVVAELNKRLKSKYSITKVNNVMYDLYEYECAKPNVVVLVVMNWVNKLFNLLLT